MLKKTVLLCLLWFVAMAYVSASVPVEGNFFSQRQCPAYLSKNNKTNPDNWQIEIGERYPLVEINREHMPDWFRIHTTDPRNPLRWVHRDCGNFSYDLQPKKQCDRSPGKADANVLALSWQPGFCETYGYGVGKPECVQLRENAYSQKHFVFHGFWPNQEGCGIHYDFCQARPRARHCDYAPLTLRSDVAEKLRVLMPSYAFGSCLERHEWYKHGTCQLKDKNNYFLMGMRLSQQMDHTPFADIVRKYRGGRVALSALKKALDQSFGSGSHKKIYLGCSKGQLVDVYIQLPARVHEEDDLGQLLQQANTFGNTKGCPTMVKISDFSVNGDADFFSFAGGSG